MNLGHISHYFCPLCQGFDWCYYTLPFDDFFMYHVLALLIIWIWFLYNFDNKHTFIGIVIVIVIDYFDAMRWYCLNNFVIVLSDKYINSVISSIRWTYLNFNVYRLSCPFHNNELSPVNEGRIKSGTFFKHMLNSSALIFLGIDLILILGITRSMEISAVFHSTDSLLAQSQVNVCHWAAQGDFERVSGNIVSPLHLI